MLLVLFLRDPFNSEHLREISYLSIQYEVCVPLCKESTVLKIGRRSASRDYSSGSVSSGKKRNLRSLQTQLQCRTIEDIMKSMVSSLIPLFLSWSLVSAQAPFFTTPQFTNITHRTNVCDRFLQYAEGKIEIRDALSGLNLTVGVVDQPNELYLRFNEDGTIDEDNPGIFVVLLDELARRANFTWRFSYARILPPNTTANLMVTWTDVLLDSVNRYDLSFAEWVQSHERRKLGVSFPVGWYDTSTIFIRNTRVGIINDFNFRSWLKPFDTTLWLLLCLGFVYSRAMYWVLEKIGDDGSPKEISSLDKILRLRMVEMVYDSDRSNAKRIFNMSISIFSMVFVSSYTANLATHLISKSLPDFNYVSMEDLDSRFTPICVRENDAVFEQLSLDFKTMNFKRSPDVLQNYKNLIAGECKVVATRRADFDIFEREKAANPACTLEWVGRAEYINFGGMATIVDMNTSCTSLVGHVLDLHMHEMTEFLQDAWEDFLGAKSDYQCPPKKDTDDDSRYSLTLNDIGGIFIVFCVLAMVGLVAAIPEQYYVRKKLRLEEANMKGEKSSDEDGKHYSSVNMSGQVKESTSESIVIDPDVLQKIISIDEVLSKLRDEIKMKKGMPSSFPRGSRGARRRGGSVISPSSSPKRPGGRPSLSSAGRRPSKMNVLELG
jgi:hypothetical protein